MGNGVIFKSNGSKWTAPIVKKADGTNLQDTVVEHSNGVTWYSNYPMSQEYTLDFTPTWAQGYNHSGVKLDAGTWGDKLWSGGSTMDGHSLVGYDKTKINDFAMFAGVKILSVYFHVNLESYSHNGNASVNFYPHQFDFKPSTYNSAYVKEGYVASKTFIKGSWGGYWIACPTSFITALANDFNGIAFHAPEATAVNSCKFTGLSTWKHTLRIKVMSPNGYVLSNGKWVPATSMA